MRIIGGTARGRRLFAPEGNETRPTSDRVREALFNILRLDVPDAIVLDLFAGSGALSIEALSRGAERAVLVDMSRKASGVIRRNLELSGFADNARLIVADWRAAISQMAGETFSLVFLDPPYRMENLYAEAPAALADMGRLQEDCLLVLEHTKTFIPALREDFVLQDARAYGDTRLSLYRWRKEVDA